MNQICASAIVALVVAIGSPVIAQLPKDAAIAKAETILKNLQEGKTADVAKEFDARMTQGLPESRLKTAWPGIIAQFGAFRDIKERREGQYQGRQAVELILIFEKETVVQRIVFDSDGKVDGLVFIPLSAAVLPAQR